MDPVVDPAEGQTLLHGLRVLDLSTMIAAPLAATILGDYGADIVKVEMPGPGDHVRGFGAQKDGVGLYWKALSRGKSSVALDLRSPEGKDLLRRWVAQFDVLIENFRPGTLERWDLAPCDLRAAHPALIVLRVTAYGQDGPYSAQPGFGTLAEAMTGLASVSGRGWRRYRPRHLRGRAQARGGRHPGVPAARHRARPHRQQVRPRCPSW